MSSKQQLPPHSNASSSSKPVTHRPLKQTLLVSKVPVGPTDEALLRDLQKSCVGVLNVTRLQDRNGRPVGAILVHFTSQVVADRVFAQGHVFLMGERREVRLHFVPFCDHCQVEGHIVARCPHLDPDDGRSEEAERRPVDSPRVPLECYRCHQEGHRAAQCPHRPLTESRLMHLFQQQQRSVTSRVSFFTSLSLSLWLQTDRRDDRRIRTQMD